MKAAPVVFLSVAMFGLLIAGFGFVAYSQGGGTTTTQGCTSTVNYGATCTATMPVTTCLSSCNPSLTVSFPSSSFAGYAGAPIYFSASASGGTPGYTYAWAFGDGATATTTLGTVQHAYAAAGVFSLSLKVTDSAGASASAFATVTISNPTPPANTYFVVVDVVSPGSAPYYNNPSPIGGALVTLGTYSGTTDSASGQVSFTVPAGNYPLTVTATGWATYTSTVSITANKIITVSMTPGCYPACGLSIAGGLFGASPLLLIGLGLSMFAGGSLGAILTEKEGAPDG